MDFPIILPTETSISGWIFPYSPHDLPRHRLLWRLGHGLEELSGQALHVRVVEHWGVLEDGKIPFMDEHMGKSY